MFYQYRKMWTGSAKRCHHAVGIEEPRFHFWGNYSETIHLRWGKHVSCSRMERPAQSDTEFRFDRRRSRRARGNLGALGDVRLAREWAGPGPKCPEARATVGRFAPEPQ